MSFSNLPAINAALNGLSAILLGFGYYFIRRRNQTAHSRCMIAAFVTSTLFLICYLTYHFKAGRTVFKNPPEVRPWYLILLFTHTVLAVVIVPMVLVTLNRAFKLRFERHKMIARWTWPLWMYVSLTGVIIYWLLYIKYPQTQ
jgi:putative membrane protein